MQDVYHQPEFPFRAPLRDLEKLLKGSIILRCLLSGIFIESIGFDTASRSNPKPPNPKT